MSDIIDWSKQMGHGSSLSPALPEGCEKHSGVCGGPWEFNPLTGKVCPVDQRMAMQVSCAWFGPGQRRERVAHIRATIARAKTQNWPPAAQQELGRTLVIEEEKLAVEETKAAEAQRPSPRLQSRYELEAREAFAKVPWWGWLVGGAILVSLVRKK